MTGQSAQAACNSDAKTIEVGVQAYINSPDNATNSAPTSVGDLITAPFNNPNGQADTFLQQKPNEQALYTIALGGAKPTRSMVAFPRVERRCLRRTVVNGHSARPGASAFPKHPVQAVTT